MISAIIVLMLTGAVSFSMIGNWKRKDPRLNEGQLKNLFFYHIFFFVVYLIYAAFNPSDSQFYYIKVEHDFRGDSWFDFYGTSTTFIEFVAYPFIKFLGVSYEGMMALFAWLGYLGYIYFYRFFSENLKHKHTLFGVDLVTLIFFLPNLHFWSVSLGKGSIIFLGIGLFFFGISQLKERIPAVVFGAIIIYHVRPHIMLIMLVSATAGFIFSNKSVSITVRVAFLACASVVFAYIYQDVLSMVGVSDEELLGGQGVDLSHRASELSKAGSGVNIANYSLPMQVFTFLYRPLFVDAPGVLGLIVSFENVFYVLITLRIFSGKTFRSLVFGDFLIKTAFLSFLTVSVALAQISGNLGLAMRQKSQVMMLFLFVIAKVMDEQKAVKTARASARSLRPFRPSPQSRVSNINTMPRESLRP